MEQQRNEICPKKSAKHRTLRKSTSLGGFVSMMVREKDREYALYANSKGSSNS
jgi:hypothetical protein